MDRGTEPTGEPGRWFGRPEGGFSLRPLTWQGRWLLALWAVLCVLAISLYTSQLGLLVLVVLLYTAILGGFLLVKSDLKAEFERRARGGGR